MSILLDEILAQAANGSPATVALSAESVAVLLFASGFIDQRESWIDKREDPLDEVTDEDWDTIEKLVGNAYEEIMNPVLFIGQIMMHGAEDAPDGWLLCEGDAVSRETYADLFDVIGETWGAGDGTTTFNIPDFRYRSPMGLSVVPTLAIGEAAGEAAHALTQTENAGHSHTVNDPGHVHRERVSTGVNASVFTAGGGGNSTVASAATVGTAALNTVAAETGITLENSGNGVPHNTVHPVRGVPFIIYAGV